MGLFSNKQKQDQNPSDEVGADIAQEVFDAQYREELRQAGREHFKHLLEKSSVDLKKDIDATMRQVAVDLKEYMTHQLDTTITNINTEITGQMKDRVSEFNRVTNDVQSLISQSLNQNAQAVGEKYQQLSATMQQTVASQEASMLTMFQDNKAKVIAVQNEQDKALAALKHDIESARQQSEELNRTLQKSISEQNTRLSQVYQENMTRVAATRDAQAKSLEMINSSAANLQEQYQQLGELLDKSLAQQKAMMVGAINDNLARIIEHYLIGALGEQSEFKAQLPSIMEQLEQNKQAMLEDMKL